MAHGTSVSIEAKEMAKVRRRKGDTVASQMVSDSRRDRVGDVTGEGPAAVRHIENPWSGIQSISSRTAA